MVKPARAGRLETAATAPCAINTLEARISDVPGDTRLLSMRNERD
jgi:hypothetical protein